MMEFIYLIKLVEYNIYENGMLPPILIPDSRIIIQISYLTSYLCRSIVYLPVLG